jgi:hypothetical protein
VGTFKVILSVCLLGALGWGSPAQTGAGGLTVAEFDRLHKELTSIKEPWQTLPWQLSLLEARTEAARENKPIYMLCRSGHPLGCV